MKGLETLQEIKSKPFSWEKLKDSLYTIEKELKALEIIKNKELNVFFIKRYTRKDFNFMCRYEQQLTQEEYNLLKEVLNETTD